MAGEWQDVSLGDLFKVKHGFAFKGEHFTNEKHKTVLVTPGNFAVGGGFKDEKRRYYRGPILSDYILKPGQIVVTMTDLSKEADTLGFAGRIPDDSNTWLHNQRVGLLEFKHKAPAIPRFVEYLLRSHEYRSWVIGSATGTTVKHTSPGRIESFTTRIPPLAEQRAIAYILGSFDDKIALIRQRNQTLESMARALFHDWFVDFGPVRAKVEGREPYLPTEIWKIFPKRFDASGKPEGWDEKPLSSMFTIIGGGTPKTSITEYWGGDIPWFSVVDTPSASDVFVITTEKSITEQGLTESSARRVPKGTTIISARGTVGNLAITGCPMTFNQSCYGLQGVAGIGDYFVYLTAQQMVDQLKSMAHGSVFSTITRQTFEAIKRPLPPPEIIKKFEALVLEWFEEIFSSVEESRTLVSLRDTLLPKLISGELRIKDAKRFIEDNI
ncbi:restriction endonuclease subunit S [Pseudomonas rhodesiae]|uniref:Type I restriction enzyme, S subunit n=1 Tax=Pseudomonas rhodesiae TaxID=76760 RepID=A0AAE8KXE7_9PSED|nr:restriction endonuclease subunit S [Pseudomonas rhodesiae]TWR52038.1 restriction endonuclease subunit S [Pseudomonas rhodesiae]SDU88414.1 type I restriction enzyme, S subunit [Pseudomonas rhodesiae]